MAFPPLSDEVCENLRAKFYENPINILAQNTCTINNPLDICMSRCRIQETQHVFSHKIEEEGTVTDQKGAGLCWMFAGLNTVRIPFMKKFDLDEFEFSQPYLFFWDKFEKSYSFLNKIVDTARRNEPIDGRLMRYLLVDPVSDGGDWMSLVDLINKYGLMPKKNFRGTINSEHSVEVNSMLNSKLREFAVVLRKMVEDGKSDSEIRAKIDEQVVIVYRIIGICMGIPEKKFTWTYVDKSKKYHSIGPITPKEFYETHVRPIYNVDDKVCLVSDPRPTVKYNQAYIIGEFPRTIIGGREVIMNNQPIELLIDLCVQSIKNNEPVWFTYDVAKCTSGAIYDLKLYDSTSILGVDLLSQMTKAERLIYAESRSNHSSILTAVSLDDDDKPTKWRAQNSWGPDSGEKGYYLMTNDWFKEFVFEVVVDKSIVPKEVMEVFEKDPVKLSVWEWKL